MLLEYIALFSALKIIWSNVDFCFQNYKLKVLIKNHKCSTTSVVVTKSVYVGLFIGICHGISPAC